MAASPAVANRIGLDGFHLARRQLVLLPVAAAIMISISLAGPRMVRRMAIVAFILSLGLTALTLVAGSEIKGATRWISIFGISLQPSEFLKPSFAVVAAWLFACTLRGKSCSGQRHRARALPLGRPLLIKQPDLGMTVVVTAMFFTQFFAAGLPISGWA